MRVLCLREDVSSGPDTLFQVGHDCQILHRLIREYPEELMHVKHEGIKAIGQLGVNNAISQTTNRGRPTH